MCNKTILTLYILVICVNFAVMKIAEKPTASILKGNIFSKNTSIIKDGKLTEMDNEFSQEHIAVQQWRKNDARARKMCEMIYNKILPYVSNGSKEMDLSPSCSRALMKTLIGLKHYKLWAFRMIDSTGKLPTGILNLDVNVLGNYDECLKVNVPGYFRGQYCNLNLNLPLPERRPFTSPFDPLPEFVNFSRSVPNDSVTAHLLGKIGFFYSGSPTTAVCVPSTCTKEEIQKVVNKVIQSTQISVDAVVTTCDVMEEKYEFSSTEISIITVLGILLFIGIISTAIDVYIKLTTEEENCHDNLRFPTKCLLCFSFYTNSKRLTAPDTSPDTIKIFHGIRVISMMWIILGHTYLYQIKHASSHMYNLVEYNKDISFQVITEAFMAVDTFFFISAVVHSYDIMKLKDVKINYGLHILRRILRLAIPFSFVMACVFLVPYLGSGPVWKETIEKKFIKACRNNWWTNFLFLSNFMPINDMCLSWFWYIPVDLHLFVISLLVIIPMKSNPRLAFATNLFILLSGICISEAFRYSNGLITVPTHAYGHPHDFWYLVNVEYCRTYEHCSSCCIGLVVGYFLGTRILKLKFSWKINLALWLSAFILGLSVIFGVYDWNQGNLPHIIICVLYKSTKRIWWSLALAWVTIACMTGNGGFIYDILSWRGFVTLARLTYMVYLIHPIVMVVYLGSTRTLIEITHRSLVYLYIGNVVLSFMCAYGCSLLFESPFMALQNLIISLFIPEDLKRYQTLSSLKKEMKEVTKMPLAGQANTEDDSYPVKKDEINTNEYGTMNYRKFQ